MRDTHHTQNGAVFYYILLAVALIAALSYVVSRDNRGSVSALSDDQARIAANEIIEYGNTVAQAVQKLRLRGCGDTEISFENPIITSPVGFNYENGINTSCHVFNLNGGSINYSLVPPQYIKSINSANTYFGEYVFSGNAGFLGVGSDCANARCNELFMAIPYLDDSICLQINKSVGIPNISNSPPSDNANFGLETFRSASLYKYEAGNNVEDIINDDLTGKNVGCFYGNNDPGAAGNTFFQILIAR